MTTLRIALKLFLALFLVFLFNSLSLAKPVIKVASPPCERIVPLIYMEHLSQQGKLDFKVEVKPIKDDMIKLMIASEKVDFMAVPSTTAANFYNKGANVKLIVVSYWGDFQVLSKKEVSSFKDLRGKKIIVPRQGNLLDAIFKYLAKKNGLSVKDVKIEYGCKSPVMVSNLLLSDKIDFAVLPEPFASIAVSKGKGKIKRVIDITKEYEKVTKHELPQAGLIVIGEKSNEIIKEFMEGYKKAIEFVNENPEQAGKLTEKKMGKFYKIKPIALSMKYSRIKYVPAKDVEENLNYFFNIILNFSPKTIGGKLPDKKLYDNFTNCRKNE
jgi:NitT/TauT family transport system substrate-binding protein